MNNKEIANGPLLSPTSTPPEESDSNEPRERTGYKGMYTAVRQINVGPAIWSSMPQ